MTKLSKELLDRMAYDMAMEEWVAINSAKPSIKDTRAFSDMIAETLKEIPLAQASPFVGWDKDNT